MADPDDPPHPARTATEVLAELVAKRKAGGGGGAVSRQGMRQAERSAAAKSASKSKPALRK